MDEIYDIVVVGAGPAGSSAALAAAQSGVTVLLIDQRQRIGVPVQCAEFVPQGISRSIQFSPHCVVQTVETMVTHLPGDSVFEMRSPGYMLDRSLFDRELAASTILKGARIAIQTRVTGLGQDGVVVEREGKTEVIRSKVVIAADGAHSSIARFLGRPPLKNVAALQYEVAIPPGRPNHVHVFFERDFEGGYAWLFPKGKTANVGLGIVPRKANLLSKLLDGFLAGLLDAGMIAGADVLGRTGGSIPCEISPIAVFRNVLLAGDAAGHAHAITGAGILNAVLGGEMAGRIAAEAIIRKDLAYLESYETEWREGFGMPLFYAASKRETMERDWDGPGVDFENLIRGTWSGFKEYYKDRKRLNI